MAQNHTWFPQLKNVGENCWVGDASWLLYPGWARTRYWAYLSQGFLPGC